MFNRNRVINGFGLMFALAVLALAVFEVPIGPARAQVPPQCSPQTVTFVSVQQVPIDRCIVIVKDTEPDGALPFFDFTTDTPTTDDAFSLLDTQEAGIVVDADGAYIITESPANGWELADIVCTDVNRFTVVEDLDNNRVTLTTTAGTGTFTAVCTFINELAGCGLAGAPQGFGIQQVTPCLRITKQAEPDDTGEMFPFDIAGDFTDSFQLLDDGSQEYTFDEIGAEIGDEITITETVPDGWELADIVCDGDGVTIIEDEGTATATITFDGGVDITSVECTFFNEATVAALSILKTCPLGPGEDATFNVQVDGPAGEEVDTVECDGSIDLEDLEPGDYTVTEMITGADAENFLVAFACEDEDGVVVTQGNSADVTLDPGATVVCVLINTFDEDAAGEEPPVDDGGNGNTNNNLNLNDNTNNLINDNINTNDNTNENSQEQENEQNQTNHNNQIVNVHSSPEVNIDWD